jgi:enoyl-CoA hydratase/carnithine racemase
MRINDTLIAQIHTVFVNLPADVRAVILSGAGEHFCAGLDLSELVERNTLAAVQHSRGWHAAFEAIQYGKVPVIAVLHGAVVGGGLEIAASCHIRVAEAFGLLRPARRPARHLRRRRRLGAHPAADRHLRA